MNYNLFIQTQSSTYNIFNIRQDDLEIVVNAFNKGKSDFFIAGKKYWIAQLFEIRIFSFQHPDKFKDFISLANSKRLFQKDAFGDPYLTPKVLKEGGEEITRDYIKGDFGFLSDLKEQDKTKFKMDIFISHLSSDLKIAKLIIDILRKAFNITSEKIRCTSVPGYKLKAGANTDEQLKKEIFSSKVFIGLITKESVNSTYVLFELGARWGVDLPLIPLICDKAGASLLNGPIKNINALSAIDSSDMLQFLNDLGDVLDLKPENPSGYIDDIEKLKKIIIGESEKVISKPLPQVDEYKNADEIIKKQSEIEWSDNYEMRVDYIEKQREAVKKLQIGRPDDLTDGEFDRIRARAKKEWPLNFVMRLDEEERQIESLRKLKNI